MYLHDYSVRQDYVCSDGGKKKHGVRHCRMNAGNTRQHMGSRHSSHMFQFLLLTSNVVCSNVTVNVLISSVGIDDGDSDGSWVGPSEGDDVGSGVGATLGCGVGLPVGDRVGCGVGRRVGCGVGPRVGNGVGRRVGDGVGRRVG